MAISNTSLNPMDTLVQTIGTALSGAKDTDKALAGLVKKGVVSQAQATRVAALFADSSFEAKPAQLKALKSALKQATSSTRPHSVSTDGMRGGNVSGGAQLRVHQVMSQAGDFRADLLFSRNATRELKEAMGPEAMGFFKHYKDLALLDITKAAPSRDLDARIDESTKALMRSISPVDGEGLSPTVKNALHEGVETLKNDLAALRRRPGGPRITERMHQRFRDLMILVARDKDVFIRPNDQELGFDRLQLMSPRETQLEILKDEDPQAYAAVQFQRETYAEIDKKIERAMKRGGLVPSKMRILNRLVNVGTDPVTGEEWVFDLDGQRLSIEDFSEKRKAFFKAQSMLEGRITRTEVPLDQLRHVDEAALQTLLEEQEPAYISLTDDKAKDGQLTRIYPTVWHEGHRVIIEGRFEGIYTDDLINSEGRLIEGTAWTYNPRSGRSHPVEYNPGEREPYITLAQVKEKGKIKEKLFIQLPYFQGEWTSFRQAIRKLANAVPS
ncbi:hypothetical protein KAI87_16535, partial [Myxococcota bacterium]|nr:hypothetical protein [Myxococcota bacterium]